MRIVHLVVDKGRVFLRLGKLRSRSAVHLRTGKGHHYVSWLRGEENQFALNVQLVHAFSVRDK